MLLRKDTNPRAIQSRDRRGCHPGRKTPLAPVFHTAAAESRTEVVVWRRHCRRSIYSGPSGWSLHAAGPRARGHLTWVPIRDVSCAQACGARERPEYRCRDRTPPLFSSEGLLPVRLFLHKSLVGMFPMSALDSSARYKYRDASSSDGELLTS